MRILSKLKKLQGCLSVLEPIYEINDSTKQEVFHFFYAKGREVELLKTPQMQGLPNSKITRKMKVKHFFEQEMQEMYDEKTIVDLLKNNPEKFFSRGWVYYDKFYNQDTFCMTDSFKHHNILMPAWRTLLPDQFFENPENFVVFGEASAKFVNMNAPNTSLTDENAHKIWHDYYWWGKKLLDLVECRGFDCGHIKFHNHTSCAGLDTAYENLKKICKEKQQAKHEQNL